MSDWTDHEPASGHTDPRWQTRLSGALGRVRPSRPRHDRDETDDGGALVGARPRRPRPSRSGGAAAEPPASDVYDIEAIGRER